QLARQPRPIHLVVFQDVRAVAVRRVQQLQQIVLYLDVVVRAREAEPRRRLDRAPGLMIQLPDQRPQVYAHDSLPRIPRIASAVRPLTLQPFPAPRPTTPAPSRPPRAWMAQTGSTSTSPAAAARRHPRPAGSPAPRPRPA